MYVENLKGKREGKREKDKAISGGRGDNVSILDVRVLGDPYPSK